MAAPRHTPCDVYIRYLVLCPEKYSTDQVVAFLQDKQLDFYAPSHVDKLRNSMVPPHGFNPGNLRHKQTALFLESTGTYRLFYPDDATREAHRHVNNPRAKWIIEVATLSGAANDMVLWWLAEAGIKATLAGILRYKAFYFNESLVDPMEMRVFMRLRSKGAREHEDFHEKQFSMLMREASAVDERIFSADTATTTLKQAAYLVRRGGTLDHVKLAALSGTMARLALMQGVEHMTRSGGKEASTTALQFVCAAEKLIAIEEAHKTVGSSTKKQFQQFRIEQDSSTVPYAGELEGTIDVPGVSGRQPQQFANNEDDDDDDDDSPKNTSG